MMKNLHLLVYFLIAITSACCASDEMNYPLCEDEDYMQVSIYSLVTNPKEYRNIPVRVEGYFLASERSSALFVDKNAIEHYIFENGIKLDLNDREINTYKSLNGTWKHLYGRFNVSQNRFGFYSGRLSEICFDEDWQLLRRSE